MKKESQKRLFSVIVSLCMALVLLPPRIMAATVPDAADMKIEDTADGERILKEYTGSEVDIILPDGITTIGDYAFQGMDIVAVELPASVTKIGKDSFRFAEKLTKIVMPNVTEIGRQAFEGTALTEVNMPSVKKIGERAFRLTENMTSVNMPLAESIGSMAFSMTGLINISLPSAVKVLDNAIFWGCNKIASVSVPVGIFTVDGTAFNADAFSTMPSNVVFELIADAQDIELTANGITVDNKTTSFSDGTICFTKVIANGGNITNQTGKTITVNGNKLLNNSVKLVGEAVTNDAYLADMSIEGVTLIPEFGNLTENYEAQVDYTKETVSVKAVPSDDKAAVAINGSAANAANGYTVSVALTEGDNTIVIAVTSEDGNTLKNYNVLLKKLPQPQNITIKTPEELIAFAADVNAGKYDGVPNVTAELVDNIDMTGREWTPIGDTFSHYFSGIFEGNGYTISNLAVKHTANGQQLGLFGAAEATILNVNVTGTLHNTVASSQGSNFGGILGYGENVTIDGCTAEFVQIEEQGSPKLFGLCIGGIAGQLGYSRVENCVSKTNFAGDNSGILYIGGIVGASVGTEISNCLNEGNITITSGSFIAAGGICGAPQTGTEISYSVNNGKIDTAGRNSYSNTRIGGIAGYGTRAVTINHCTNNGEVIGHAVSMGGIVGEIALYGSETGGSLKNCLNNGSINLMSGNYVGGIAAYMNNTTAAGEIVETCVSLGSVTAQTPSARVHAIVPNAGNGVEFKNNYYDSEITAQGSIADVVTNGSTAKPATELNSEDFILEIKGLGGDYRLDSGGKLEVMPMLYEVIINDSNAVISGAGFYEAGAVVSIDSGDAKSGYAFGGWLSDDITIAQPLNNKTTFVMPEKAVTLTAQWRKRSSGGGGATTYTVRFETNGGSAINTQIIRLNGEVVKPENPIRAGYKFDGWYSDKELTKSYNFSAIVRSNLTLYAKWIEEVPDETPKPTETPSPIETQTPEWNNTFEDVKPDDWYYNDVKYVVENELFNGISSAQFAPNETITRAMMTTILYRAENEPETTGISSFKDIEPGAYYEKAVAWAQENGIVTGYSETEFRPNEGIIREQIAVIMYRYAQYKKYDVSVGENTDIHYYADSEAVSEYAVPAVRYVVGGEFMKGKSESTINPRDNATRAEIAAIFHRFAKANKK